jgi:hypothetical protein
MTDYLKTRHVYMDMPVKDLKVYPAKGTQCAKLLDFMRQTRECVTPLSALRIAGSLRASERFRELEAMGWEIERGWVKTSGGARVRSYRLKA